MDDDNKKSIPGLIPDFFHDVIAYFIPGFTFLLLTTLNCYIHFQKVDFLNEKYTFIISTASIFISYIFGKFFEQIGYLSIHKGLPQKSYLWCNNNRACGKCDSVKKWNTHKPKWNIIFHPQDDTYTKQFKLTLTNKIEEWLVKLDGKALMQDCKDNHKDDYFNLIQFYLRERFPQVALYEKKQNASIVLTRSLCIIFLINPLVYSVVPFLFFEGVQKTIPTTFVTFYISLSFIFSFVFYKRFRLDQRYHAMYIFEAFLATKKLLKKTKNNTQQPNSPSDSFQANK